MRLRLVRAPALVMVVVLLGVISAGCGAEPLDRAGCLEAYDEEVTPARQGAGDAEAMAALRRFGDEHPECTGAGPAR